MEALINFGGEEFPVRKDKDGNVCLTDLWKMTGSDQSKAPYAWSRLPLSIGFIKATAAFLKYEIITCLKTTRGKNGATWAHPLVALEYASYLSPELAVVVNQNFLDRVEEEKNPDLIADRYVRTYKKRGKDEGWISDRFNGLLVRKELTATLKVHGVEHEGYRNITNAIYDPLYGGSSNVVREKKGLDKKQSIRDNLPRLELRAIELAEMMTIENIKVNHLRGNAQCEIAAKKAGRAVANALLQSRK